MGIEPRPPITIVYNRYFKYLEIQSIRELQDVRIGIRNIYDKHWTLPDPGDHPHWEERVIEAERIYKYSLDEFPDYLGIPEEVEMGWEDEFGLYRGVVKITGA